ncbi:DUF4124 domain-containing protein [Pleionea sediminis]|uniref:DUF4124 domain-containing protein n=1 Tax=Pleionea sediminis TaxID=2569479 RepID=UPI00118547C0|nr:DUF4124 domain-containing protein [Pleionea sediminis]
MFRQTIIAAVLAITTSLVFAGSNVLYKWKDAEGNTKYGDRPPKGVPFERIKVRGSNSSAAITEKIEAEENPQTDAQKEVAKMQAQITQACKIAKTNMETLNSGSRIKKDGEDRMLTEEEIEQKKVETQKQIDNYCAELNQNKEQSDDQ